MVMAGFIDAMIRDLGASDAKTRWNAANGLGHVGPAAESAAPALFCCAEEDEDCSVREAARVALGKIFPKLAMARSDR
jgi:HEAT repeat protein